MNRSSRHGGHRPRGSDHRPSEDPDVLKFFHPESKPSFDRKARQLCDQVRRTLEFALEWECDAELLEGIWIASVDPAPDASRLRVTIEVPEGRDPAAVLEGLERLRPRLRSETARAITRKRAPDFFFVSGTGEVP